MPPPRTRDEVIEAARRWIGDRDPSEISLRELARALQMTPTGLYRYIGSVDELFGRTPEPVADPVETQDEFVADFVTRATRPERIATLVEELVGDTVVAEPLLLPRLTVQAAGKVGAVSATRTAGSAVAVRVPVTVGVDIQIGRKRLDRYYFDVTVPLTIVPRVTSPLQLHVDVRRPEPRQIEVRAIERAMPRSLRTLARVDALIRTRTLESIERILASPRGRASTAIDVGRLVDDAWSHGLVLPTLEEETPPRD